MPLTDQERARLQAKFVELARGALCLAAPLDEVWRRQAMDAPDWRAPIDNDADAFVLFGFARLCKAVARGRFQILERRAAMLAVVAGEVLAIFQAEPAPILPLAQRRLPYSDD